MITNFISFFADVVHCQPDHGDFFAFPTWYRYLDGVINDKGKCDLVINNINDVWLIVAAVIEILLRVAALLAVVFIIYGSINYIVSQGEPDKTAKARNTIVNAMIGLALAILSAAIISFIAGSIN